MQHTTIIDAALSVVSMSSLITFERTSRITTEFDISSIEQITKTVTAQVDFGACDVFSSGVDADKYEFAQLGNRFSVYENIKFSQDLGLATYAGQPISQEYSPRNGDLLSNYYYR